MSRRGHHVSLDLETMASVPSAAIVQIGAYAVNGVEIEPDPARSFSVNVDLADAMRRGCIVDAATIYWWLRQSDYARAALVSPEPVPLPDALEALNAWLLSFGPASRLHLWSHATFDAVILMESYRVAGVTPAPHYRQMADLRTLDHFPKHDTVDLKHRHEHEHSALHDAWAQGQAVARALEAVRRSEQS